MYVPEFALRVLVVELLTAVFCFSAFKLVRYFLKWRKKQQVKLYRIALFSVSAILAMALLIEGSILSISAILILGVLLIANAYMVFVKAMKALKNGGKVWQLGATSSLVSLLLGIVALVTMDAALGGYITYVGLYLLATGVSEIGVSIYNNVQSNNER